MTRKGKKKGGGGGSECAYISYDVLFKHLFRHTICYVVPILGIFDKEWLFKCDRVVAKGHKLGRPSLLPSVSTASVSRSKVSQRRKHPGGENKFVMNH